MAEKRVSRWYFGGLASCGAACCTHPLDLLKVHLQTQQEVKLRMTGMALRVVRNDGFLALYNGLSASLCRQVGATEIADCQPIPSCSPPYRDVCIHFLAPSLPAGTRQLLPKVQAIPKIQPRDRIWRHGQVFGDDVVLPETYHLN